MLTICSTRLGVNKLLDICHTKDTSANYVESTVPLENNFLYTYRLYALC